MGDYVDEKREVFAEKIQFLVKGGLEDGSKN